MLPSVVSSLVILLANHLYQAMAQKMVNEENIKEKAHHETRLATLLYKFSFVNSYTYFFLIAFWERSIGKLAYQLFTFLCIKQIAFNIIEYFQNRIYVGRLKQSYVTKVFNSLLAFKSPSQDGEVKDEADLV